MSVTLPMPITVTLYQRESPRLANSILHTMQTNKGGALIASTPLVRPDMGTSTNRIATSLPTKPCPVVTAERDNRA